MISQAQTMQQASTFAGGKLTSISSYADSIQVLCEVMISNRLEFFMFCSAVLGYLVLFWIRLPKGSACHKSETFDAPSNLAQQTAIADCSVVKSCVNGFSGSCASFEQASTVSLVDIVQSMRSAKKDAQNIASELSRYLQQNPEACAMSNVNAILSGLGEQLDSELAEAILHMLPSVGLQKDQQTCEIVLKMYVASRDYTEVQRFVSEMNASKTPLGARATFFVMKAALQAQNFAETMKYLRELRASWKGCSTSEAFVPHVVMLALVELAAQEHELGQLVRELGGMPLPEKTVDAMLFKCVDPPDAETARCVESFARAQRPKLPDSTLSLLIKATSARPLRMRGIIEEVMGREDSEFSPDLALTVLDSCRSASDAAIVSSLFQRMKPKQSNVLAAFIWFYIGVEQFDKACDIYELDMQVLSSHAGGSITLDVSLQESIVDAAVLCGRTHLAERVMAQIAQARSETAGCLGMLRRSTSWIQELSGTALAAVARWNEVISHWVVLVL